MAAAKRNAELAASTPDANQYRAKKEQASERLTRWLGKRQLDDDTVAEVTDAFLQTMEDSYPLVMHPGEFDDADQPSTLRQRAAVTRDWLRNQGYNVPVYPKQPGL
ncbi:hypothetical protein [Streptomyces sp. NPDC085479]|uniref:hypothetical protein n=1 Tax=Streptomyces sp. NPDC085479 TaxID=3365726 RepID=UPI0037D07881